MESHLFARGFQKSGPQVDVEGYYQPTVGEIVKGRYRVSGIAGRGVFSFVVKALDATPAGPQYQEVAIKIIRMFDIMRESVEKEREIVMQLNRADCKIRNMFIYSKLPHV